MKHSLLIMARFCLVMLFGLGVTSCIKTEYIDNPIPVAHGNPTIAETGHLEFPEGSKLNYNDINLYGDGQVLQVGADGTFTTDASTLLATNGDNVVFWSYTIPEVPTTLNSIETAISVLLPTVPFAATSLNKDQLWIFKQMIGHLEETKKLADAIDKSIVQTGYINLSSVDTQLKAASKAVAEMLGMNSSSSNKPHNGPAQRSISQRATPVNHPYFTATGNNKTYADGFYLTMDDYSFGQEKSGKKYTECTFTLLNANRFVYTSLSKAYKTDSGTFMRWDTSMADSFTNLIKPMNVSAFMDWGTLSDIVTDPTHFTKYLADPDFERVLNLFVEPLKDFWNLLTGKELEVASFDKVKLSDIKFRFYTENEHLAIVGPGSDSNLVFYNICKIMILPAVKLLVDFEAISLYDSEEDIYDLMIRHFLDWLLKNDYAFGENVINTYLNNSISWDQKLAMVPQITEHFINFLLQATAIGLFDSVIRRIVFAGKEDPNWKAVMGFYKSVLTGGDILLSILDFKYYGVAFEMTQCSGWETNGWPEDIPGSDL